MVVRLLAMGAITVQRASETKIQRGRIDPVARDAHDFNEKIDSPMTSFCWVALGCSGCFSGSAMVVVLGVRHAAAEPRCSRPSSCTVGSLLMFPTWLRRQATAQTMYHLKRRCRLARTADTDL